MQSLFRRNGLASRQRSPQCALPAKVHCGPGVPAGGNAPLANWIPSNLVHQSAAPGLQAVKDRRCQRSQVPSGLCPASLWCPCSRPTGPQAPHSCALPLPHPVANGANGCGSASGPTAGIWQFCFGFKDFYIKIHLRKKRCAQNNSNWQASGI